MFLNSLKLLNYIISDLENFSIKLKKTTEDDLISLIIRFISNIVHLNKE